MGEVGVRKNLASIRKYVKLWRTKEKITSGLSVPFIRYSILLLNLCRRTEYTYRDIITGVDGVSRQNFLQEIKFNLKIRDTKRITLEIMYDHKCSNWQRRSSDNCRMLIINFILPKGERGNRRKKMLLKYVTDSLINLLTGT